MELLGFEPLTASEKALWGKMVASLRSAGATSETLEGVVHAYRKEWPGITLTITAIEKHYSMFLGQAQKKITAKKSVCPECGIGGSYHLQDCSTQTRR